MNEKQFSKSLTINEYKVNDSFWKQKIDIVKDNVIPYQWDALNDNIKDAEPSHSIENFRIAAGLSKGEFKGFIFQDSDVAKWLEAVGFMLAQVDDPDLMERADGVIELIGQAQQPDGYLDTYHIINGLDKRFTNIAQNHEMYCAGHLIEAGVAYYLGTGKRKLLDICMRWADCIDDNFGPQEGKLHAYPGHEILEMALVKLYHLTDEKKYLDLAEYFINERGQSPLYFEMEREKYQNEYYWKDSYFKDQYYQSGKPVREQLVAEGHAVRAVYLYAGMAAVAKEKMDDSLYKACDTLMDNILYRQMYITGGIGQADYGEAFTFDYDLPNDLAYAETCASIGLVFFAQKMLELKNDIKYADVIEKVIYNGAISGMSQEGKKFFYVNPLEVHPEACEKDWIKKHVEPERQKWFSCACCPPNLARMIASIGAYSVTKNDSGITLHQYIGAEAETGIKGSKLNVKSGFPWNGNVKIEVSGESAEYQIRLRVPGWCSSYSYKLNGNEEKPEEKDGYLNIQRNWSVGDIIELDFDMPVIFNRAHPSVRDDIGKVAVSRGPVVYCLEEDDNGKELHRVYVRDEEDFTASESDIFGGCITLDSKGYILKNSGWDEDLYRTGSKPEFQETTLKWIPYYLWANRNLGEMIVWVHERI